MKYLKPLNEGKEWEYLMTEPFLSRQYIAASWLKDSDKIFELGGYYNPIDGFVTHSPKLIHVIDPRMDDKRVSIESSDGNREIVHEKALFDSKINYDKYDAFLCLGLDIPKKELWDDLAKFVNGIGFAVIEYPPTWQRSVDLFNHILDNSDLIIDCTVDLDLSENKLDLSDKSWKPSFKRRMVKLKRK